LRRAGDSNAEIQSLYSEEFRRQLGSLVHFGTVPEFLANELKPTATEANAITA
jgi:hypothetical protein